MKTAFVALLCALSPILSYAHFAPAELQVLVGDYQLVQGAGPCAPGIAIAFAPGAGRDPAATVLFVGDYPFPAINMGKVQFGDPAVGFTRSESFAGRDLFTGLPWLKNYTEHVLPNGPAEKSKAEVCVHRDGRVEVEVERKAPGRGELHSKCVYVRAPGGFVPPPPGGQGPQPPPPPVRQ